MSCGASGAGAREAHIRQAISLQRARSLLAAFIVSSVSGLVLFAINIAKQFGVLGEGGSSAEGGRGREGWGGVGEGVRKPWSIVRTWSSLAMAILALPHIWLNRRALAIYLGLRRS